ncbi:hypothetical protein BSKO_12677 [Bryopsis sp. KO-2023]|nr:hypothetical protein BSKO_12677 [Bryopsis sp. KO-2023]
MSAHSTLQEIGSGGELKRSGSAYRNFVQPGGRFSPEGDRYHLYVSYACPWSSRCVAAFHLKGLDGCIGMSVVHPTWQRTRPEKDEHIGWAFASPQDPPLSNANGIGAFPADDCIPDTVNGAKFIRDLYEAVNDTSGKYSVPVLWDKKNGTIVSNDSGDILDMLNSQFNAWAKHPNIDLCPADQKDKIDAINEWVYRSINDGVYRCGFAQTQAAYDLAFDEVFDGLDKCEEILGSRRFLAGNQLTTADIRLFVTLVRFDELYAVFCKANKRLVRECPNLREYVKDVYQTPGIAESVNMAHVKMHYYTTHQKLNWYAIIPKGAPAWFDEPHDRGQRFPETTL